MNDNNKLVQKPLSEVISEEIRKRIWNGEIEFGERLYEASLAEEFGVSRSSLREALQTLEFEGLLENKARRGTFVIKHSDEDVREIMEVRAILETQAFINASEVMTAEDFQQLSNIIDEMKELAKTDDWNAMFDLDLKFHLFVVHLCNNSRIVKMYDLIQVQIRTFLSELDTYYKQNKELFYKEHEDLFHALQVQDKSLIELSVRRHIYLREHE
ncbi:GntR family transcriptional regulator [Gracilibacillus caseinilyticus]|uniref:GntR family transcriptional regulator n=1 Tax=Gracilibacillus caseinilyticus TaxID=2932256 RepID=A0ABY4EW36_9BACI|nr:GntR family transcriptional regulator [Gracilibacillus caseinilyticus]UOQ48621.1 GntR family transcriptional regulator [Gracilibacillus caseinilyticus]